MRIAVDKGDVVDKGDQVDKKDKGMRKMKLRILLRILLIVLLFTIKALLIPPLGYSCVGRVLNLGVYTADDQKVMGEVISAMISESTGTKVNIIEFKSIEECRQAMLKEEIDLYIDYVASGLFFAVKEKSEAEVVSSDKAYSMGKHLFAKDLALIWLKPFGYESLQARESLPERMKGIANQALCVARRQVLDRFPVLPRLINKLANKIPNETLLELQKAQNLKISAKAFLESNKLIRWAIPQ